MVERNHDPQIESERRHEILHESPVGLIPRLLRQPRQQRGQRLLVVAALDAEPQLPNRGLTTDALAALLAALPQEPWYRAHGALVQELVPPLGFDLRVVVALRSGGGDQPGRSPGVTMRMSRSAQGGAGRGWTAGRLRPRAGRSSAGATGRRPGENDGLLPPG